MHRRLQRRAVQGRLRGGRHDRPASRGHRRHPRGLHGRHPRGPGQEEADSQLLRLILYIFLCEFFSCSRKNLSKF